MMRARLRWVAPLAVAAALAGCGRGGKDGPPAASVAAAATLLLSDEDLLTVGAGAQAGGPVITGSLQPEKKADLRAEVSSVVLQVLKDNGEAVRAGDLLVRLDDAAIRDSLASAEEAARAAAQALEQSERTLQRLKTLQAQGMSSQQTLDDAEVRRNGAQSDLVAARARAATARQQLQRTLVRAPFDGVVGERRASAGDTAQVGKELLKVWDPRTTRFEGLVSADRLHEIRAGQKVQFRVNGYPNVEFAGTIRRVDAAANATTRQVEVLVAFADPAAAPRVAGLFAEGRIDTGAAAGLALPDAAIVRRGGATFVWRVTGDRLVESAVVLGERDARRGEWPLLSGLAAGERILRRPGAALVDGQAVELASVAPAAASAAPAPGAK